MNIQSHIGNIRRNKNKTLISVLQEIQKEHGYLPREKMIECANHLNIPLIDIYGVATFYKSLSLKPMGDHRIAVCIGTACYVRGANRIVEKITGTLGVKPGETTEDRKFSLEAVRCLGCCAIGPIMVMDHRYYGEMTPVKVPLILRKAN